MDKSITAETFIDRLRSQNKDTDFSDLGNCTVAGKVIIDFSIDSSVNLGQLNFRDDVSLPDAIFGWSVNLGTATFEREFFCRNAKFLSSFKASDATFFGHFHFERAEFLFDCIIKKTSFRRGLPAFGRAKFDPRRLEIILA